MIELPEACTLAKQLGQAFKGKTIVSAAANTSPPRIRVVFRRPGVIYKAESLSDSERETLYHATVSTLKDMRDGGGRDTEKDLFGNSGGYQTILSSKTLAYPCRICGGELKRDSDAK